MPIVLNGTNGIQTPKVETSNINTPMMNSGQLGAFRNKIINGDMGISQRYGDTAQTPGASSIYIVDQWMAVPSVASKLTFQRVPDAPPGLKYSTKITVAAPGAYPPAAADFFQFWQPIEGQNVIDFGFGAANPATIAVSLWVKGSVAGTYSIALRNGTYTRSYIGTITVSATWTKQTVVLVGDNTGTWVETDNTRGLNLAIDLGSGSNYNGTAGAWAAGSTLRTAASVTFVNQVTGSTLNITGVQIEKVSAGATQGTEFEFVPYATQLAWCQRYLPCLTFTAGNQMVPGGAYSGSATQFWCNAIFPVPTRVPVTGIFASSQVFQFTQGSVGYNSTSVSYLFGGTHSSLLLFITTGMSATPGVGGSIYSTVASTILFTGAQM